MAIAGIKVLTVGQTWALPYEVRYLEQVSDVVSTIAQFQPDVIVTSKFIPAVLSAQAFNIRKKWIHVPPDSSVDAVISAVENCYIHSIWKEHPHQAANPLISVYTPTFNTGDHLREAYQSLKEQTYPNWEWVVMDDCSTDRTPERLSEIAKEDVRVRPFRSMKSLSKIGAAKDAATRMAKGSILVELDHDDMLTETALDQIRRAFESDPEVGFVYSNSSNFFENGQYQRFGDDFWKDRYRETEYRGKKWLECINPDIYDRFGPHFTQQFAWFLTVGPNHVRAFRASKFFELGGYNPNLPVADDWDLYARFFLQSKCLHIDKMLYLYRIKDNWENTTFTKNKAIQDHLALGRNNYAKEFEEKNRQLLEKKADQVRTAEEGILLTIAICTMPSRMESFTKVAQDLVAQADGKPVEVFCFLDNRKSNLSEKRNLVISGAKGKFISFVDDDDRVEPDYVDSLVQAIRGNPDADCIVFDVMVHGYTPEPKVCKYDVSFNHGEDASAYYRKPNHVMAYRTEISRLHKYRKDLSAVSEDTEWAERASLNIKKQVRVEKVLYHYLYDASKTTQLNPAPQAAPPSAQEKTASPNPPAPMKPVATSGTSLEDLTLKDVSFIVLEAVPDELTVRCLRSIKKFAKGSEIILISNGSKPLPKAAKAADLVVKLDANLGFAAGCNAGASVAKRKILCFMNNDAAFVDGTPAKLLAALTDEHPITAPYSNRAKPPQGDVPRESTPAQDQFPDMVVGLCMMIPKALYKKLGGFDPRLLTYEDDDFCARASAAGRKCRVVGGTWVDHERHATFKALKLDVNRVMAENREIFRRKNPSIRVVAIAKDEEKALGGFFMQFAGLTRDWCLLDTGSTDRTIEIAQALGVRVEKAGFKDFASARNEALDRFGVDADWIIMFDPDERMDRHTIENLKELVFRTPYDIFLSPLQAVYPDGKRKDFVPKPFLFRSRPGIRWVFKVHEKLVGSTKQVLLRNSLIEHVILLHEDGRRGKASSAYDEIMKAEPYFTNPKFKADMLKRWPILDYDRMDDDRIAKQVLGPLVSVVIPTYKRLELLERALQSIYCQDYPNHEVIVVGDSCPELSKMPKTSHPEVRIYNLASNHGSGGAEPRNHAIAAAAGRLIAYLDDDNAWKPDHLSSLYEVMRASNAVFTFSSMEVDGKDLGFTEPKHQGIDTSCVLHRKELVEKYGWWKDRVAGGYAHDWEFFSRWVKAGEKWACTKKPTLIYNAATSGQAEFLKSTVATRT
jgi:glycosyltransferase involved in cell wall biosynthesis